MIDLEKPNCWQEWDREVGVLYPWFVKSFLQELKTWTLIDKYVLEIGMGASTLWWEKKALFLKSCDTNEDWFFAVKDKMKHPANAFLAYPDEFISWLSRYQPHQFDSFDIAIIDCEPIELRDQCVPFVLDKLKYGGKLICDNWDQPEVWIPSEETKQLLSQYDCKIYKQHNHKFWQTAVFTK